MVRSDAESRIEQRRRQEWEEIEDRRHQEREQEEFRIRRDHEEAEERCECRLERQLQNQADMMQMFMMSMMDGHAKRKRDNEDNTEEEK